MTAKSYLVTGGLGFIGAGLVKALVNAGHNVRTLDDLSRGSARRLASIAGHFEQLDGDVRDYATFARAAKGMDSVCHLAAVNGTNFFYSMPDVVLDVSVKGMVNAIEACRNSGIGELLVASSSEVYQTPPRLPTDESVPLVIPDVFNPRYSYAAGKIISEVMAVNYGRKYFERVMIVRPHNVYGPDMGWEHVIPQFIMRMQELCVSGPGKVQFPIQGTGSQTRAFAFVDDAIEALMLILRDGNHLEIYNVGVDQEVTIASLAELVGHVFNREIDLLVRPLADGATQRRCPDIKKIRKLGYEPQTSLLEGVRLTASWYDANSHLSPNKSYVLPQTREN